MSYAKCVVEDHVTVSLIEINKNRTGSSTAPWGTPLYVIDNSKQVYLFIIVYPLIFVPDA